jgi:large repetitive protein
MRVMNLFRFRKAKACLAVCSLSKARAATALGGLPMLFAAILIAQTPLTIVSPLSLYNGSVGTPYTTTLFTAQGGNAPYTWSIVSGNSDGLTMSTVNNQGVLSGTPQTSQGSPFSFQVQVQDSKGQTAQQTYSLFVTSPALQIASPQSLSTGTILAAYPATSFSAQGGTAPYTWSILSGNADGLTMSSAGVLSGTPQANGSFSFVVQVSDSKGLTAQETYTLVVKASLVITPASFPAGTAGVPYNQTSPAATVSGGTAPYIWSLISGSVPGLTFVPATVTLTGTPTAGGTYSLTLQVTDSTGLAASMSFTVTIGSGALTITTPRQLPSATLNVAYSQAMAAAGGTPPYTWAANGLPSGLSINASTGLISGIPTSASPSTFIVITVTDQTLTSYKDNFSFSVNPPPVPAFTISGLPATVNAATQYPLQVNLASPFSNSISGSLMISFQPNSGLGDSTIQFSTGGQTANFAISAGSTSATFLNSQGAPVSQLQVQTGSVAGLITITVLHVVSASFDITPTPALTSSAQIMAQAPAISSVLVSSNGNGGCPQGQICLQVTGFSTAREVTQAVYNFSAAAGQTLQSSAGSITVDVSQLFTTWFASSTIGSQFILVQPFTIAGDPGSVIPASVTLTNHLGSTTYTLSQ